MVMPSPRNDTISISKRQKIDESPEMNGHGSGLVPRSYARDIDGGDESEEDERPITFKRTSGSTKTKADLKVAKVRPDIQNVISMKDSSSLGKGSSLSKVEDWKQRSQAKAKDLVSSSGAHVSANKLDHSSASVSESLPKQSKSTSHLRENSSSGKKSSLTSATSSHNSICQNQNVPFHPNINSAAQKGLQIPTESSACAASTLTSPRASVTGSKYSLHSSVHASPHQRQDASHHKPAGPSCGTVPIQPVEVGSIEHEHTKNTYSSGNSGKVVTKGSDTVALGAFIDKGGLKTKTSDPEKTVCGKISSLSGSSAKEKVASTKSAAGSKEPIQKVVLRKEEGSDSEDELPLAERLLAQKADSSRKSMVGHNSGNGHPNVDKKLEKFSNLAFMGGKSDDSDDDKPLSQRINVKLSEKAFVTEIAQTAERLDDKKLSHPDRVADTKVMPINKNTMDVSGIKKRPHEQISNCGAVSASKKHKTLTQGASPQVKPKSGSYSDDDDNIPLVQRIPPATTTIKPSSGVALARKKVLEAKTAKTSQIKKVSTAKLKMTMSKAAPGSGGGQKWTTLEHNGVIFPPPYQVHGVKMLYDGKPVDLTPEQEEVATMFAVMKDTDYVTKPKFISNFWSDWKRILGSNHIIKKLELCDFTPIYEWQLQEKEKKKLMSAEEKKRVKEEKLKLEERYMWALVDGVKEKVGNFRVEPPGLFRGRGEHPKMGKLKKRIFPEDIVINVGKDAPIPECPMPGHRWKEIRHDDTVTWLAYWNDPINSREFKYVFLAPSSSLKGQSDKEKYEKSRKLKDYIENIRSTYTKGFLSSDSTRKQIAVATYLIDRLALRAGNEKDDDEADTVGCCSLKVEHVSLIPPRSLEFDFLGKDSIRYFNTVEVDERVYKAIGDFKKSKKEGDDLFDKLDTNKLNAHLKEIMPGLTAKVFRTYNASITLDTQLQDTIGNTVLEKIASYQVANKEVAILCNHQRSVSKSHSAQMERLETKMAELEALRVELKRDLDRAKKGRPLSRDAQGNAKKKQTPEALQRKLDQTLQKIEKMKLDMRIKDDLKTVALGTSKINYMDPRITVAWCKRHEVPIEKVFNKSLLAKFSWAMDVEPDFRF